MKRFVAGSLLFWAVTAPASAADNPLFGYTHLLPSPLTLSAGTLVFGTDIAFGLTDFLQVGTNILSDLYQVYNANGKISLVDYSDFALGLTCGYVTYNYQDIDNRNPNLAVTSWLPGAVAAVGITRELAWFFGGNLNYTSAKLITEGVETSGYMHGASVESDLSFAYNALGKKSRGRGIGNALSAGVSYDVSYKLFGFGISHHWPGFHLGVHYYPGASRDRIFPIIAGGGVMHF